MVFRRVYRVVRARQVHSGLLRQCGASCDGEDEELAGDHHDISGDGKSCRSTTAAAKHFCSADERSAHVSDLVPEFSTWSPGRDHARTDWHPSSFAVTHDVDGGHEGVGSYVWTAYLGSFDVVRHTDLHFLSIVILMNTIEKSQDDTVSVPEIGGVHACLLLSCRVLRRVPDDVEGRRRGRGGDGLVVLLTYTSK